VSQLISNYQPVENELADKTILITGAAGGLGSALATLCSDYGANLILLDKNEDALNELHDKIEASTGTQPGLYPLDLRGATFYQPTRAHTTNTSFVTPTTKYR